MAVENEKNKLSHDPFDLSAIRIDSNFSDNLGARREIIMIPVRKPPPQEFIRVHPDENMRAKVFVLEWQADKESFLVHPQVAELIGKEAKPHRIVPAITATGNLFLWKMKVTLEGSPENSWNMSADIAAGKAIDHWVNVSSNMSAGAYDIRIAEGEIPEPEWPNLDLQQMLNIAFKDHYISSEEHPLVKKLKGKLQ